MRIFKTLIGRTLIATLGVLGVCLIALLHFANTAISERNEALFNNNIRLFTTFLAEQIDTGTRLKRGAMIAPQLESVFANKGLHVVSLRVTHVEGVEVAHMISPDFAGADLPTFAQPDFSETTSVSVYPLFASVRAPIILGTGDDAALVGELAVLWDKSPYIASTTQLLGQLRTAFVVMAAVLAIAVGFTLNTLVSRPLKKTLNALMAVSAGKDQVDLPTSETIEIRQMVNAMEIFIAISKERAQQLIDVSEMLDRSRIGDFSGRIEIEGDPKEERNQLRIMVNDLLQTVDLGLSETLRVLSGFSDKDLTVKMHGEFHGDFKRLKDNVNHSSETLNATLGGIIGHAGQVKEAASVLTTSSDSLSERTQRNAATLEETSAAISAVSDTLQASAQLSHDAKGLSDKARTQADLSRKVVDELVTAMQSIHKYSNDIADIISLIDDVAFQTNLLALNAGVEAARAGEHGRGFAVVASEVRGLAQRTSESASAVKTLISDSATEVKSGVARVDEAGGAIAALVSAIEQVSTCINDISAGAQEQSLSVSEINNALLELDQNTQRNAAMAEETTQQTRHLSNRAQAMQQLLQEFSVDQATSHPEEAVYARAS